MHRHAKVAVLLTLGGVLAACSDDVGPSPNIVTPRMRIATTCDPSAVRATMAAVLSEGTVKAEAVPLFNSAEQKKGAGNLAAAVPDYYAAMNVVLDEFASGRTLAAKKYGNTQDAVEFVVSSLFLCAGQQVPVDLRSTLQTVGEGAGTDRTVCAAGVGIPVDCTLPNGQTTVLAEAGFFDAPGLLLIEPNGTSGGFAEFTGVRRSEVSRIRALPIESQANYPYYSEPVIASAPSVAVDLPAAVVGVCETDHGSSSLQIVQQLESSRRFVPLPRRNELNGVKIADRLSCADAETELTLGAATPFGSSRFAVAGWRVLRGIGSALAPRPLHAAVRFDGGIGGETFSFESWFAAVEPAAFDAVDVQRTSPITGTGDGTSVLQNGISLYAQQSAPLTAMPLTSSGTAAPTAGITCTWTQSSPSTAQLLAISPENALSTTVTRTLSGGATLQVECTDGTTTRSALVAVGEVIG